MAHSIISLKIAWDQIHQERHICTDAERAVQMCISVEFIKKDTFVQVQKELYKCVSLSNSSRKTHWYRRRKSSFFTCTNMSVRCISHSLMQNWKKSLQFIFHPLNISFDMFLLTCRGLVTKV